MNHTTAIKPGTLVWVVLQFPQFHIAPGRYRSHDEGHPYPHVVKVDDPHCTIGARNVLDVYATPTEAHAAAIAKCKERIVDLQRQLAELENA